MAKPQQSTQPSRKSAHLADLRAYLQQLPSGLFRERALSMLSRVEHEARLESRLVQIAHQAVDQLQLDVKYLQFDLEATRSEREKWKRYAKELEYHLGGDADPWDEEGEEYGGSQGFDSD